MSESFIGEPVFGEGGAKRPNLNNANWRIDKEGSHPYRILPPCGLLATAGRWSFYEAIHWGFALSNGKKRPFRCIQRKNRKTQMVEVECPMCNLITQKQAAYAERVEELKKKNRTPTEIKELVKPLELWFRTFNLEKAHFLNVLRPDGQIGRLKIKIKQKQNLDLVLKTLMEKKGINPVSAKQGVWIDFQRMGTGRHDTTYPVEIVKEEVDINGVKAEVIKMAPLTQEVLERLPKEAFELATYYKDLSYDEINMLVTSGGDPEIADSIFGAPKVSANTAQTSQVDLSEEYEQEEDHSPGSESDNNEAALLAQLAALRSKKDTKEKPLANPTQNKSSELVKKEMSDADFIANFGKV